MAAHTHTHDGLDRVVQGVEVLGQSVRSGTARLTAQPVLARVGAGLKAVAAAVYAGMIANREARAFEEIARYDYRMAAERRAAMQHEDAKSAD